METIGRRIKGRSDQRQKVIEKRKKVEEVAIVISSPPKKRKYKRRRREPDSDIEDITPDSDIEDVTPANYNNDLPAAELSDTQKSSFSGLRTGSEQNLCLSEENLFEIPVVLQKSAWSSCGFGSLPVENTCLMNYLSEFQGFDAEPSVPSSSGLGKWSEQNMGLNEDNLFEIPVSLQKSVPSSSGLGKWSEQNMGLKNLSENWGLDAGTSVPSSSGLGSWSEQNRFFQKNFSEIRALEAGASSGYGNCSEEKTFCQKNLSEIRGLDAVKPVPDEIEIVSLSDSDSETEKKGSAKKKLFEDSSDEEDGSSETEEEEEEDQASESHNAEDVTVVESLSSDDPSFSSSSSSDEEFNSKEVIGDTEDDDLRRASLPIRNVSRAVRKPLGRPRKENKNIHKLNLRDEEEEEAVERVTKKPLGRPRKENKKIHELNLPVAEDEDEEYEEEAVEGLVRKPRNTVLTKPREEEKKILKSNCRVAAEEEPQKEAVEIVTKKQSYAVLPCNQCGKGNNTGIPDSRSSFIRPHALRDENVDMNNFASVTINSGKTSEKPSTSGPGMEHLETEREVKTLEKPSTSRPEMFVSSEKAKEVEVSVKGFTSTPEMFVSPEKPKEVEVPAKPFTSTPEYVYSEKPKEIQAPDKLSALRAEYVYSEKSKELRGTEKPSRTEIQNSGKAKEVQAKSSWMPEVEERLNKSVLADEPVDDGSGSSINSADDSGYESEPSRKEKEDTSNNNNSDWRMLDGSQTRKEVDLFRILVNSVWQKGQLDEEEDGEDKVSSPEDQSAEEDQRRYDDDGLLIIRPPPLNLMFGMEEPESPPVLSDWDIEEAKLWEEMAFCIQPNNANNELSSNVENEISVDETPRERCKKGNHELYLDLEIGMKCIHCSFVEREIRSIDEAEWGENSTRGRRKIDREEEQEEGNSSVIGFESQNNNSSNGGCVSSEGGSVWDKIPGIKSDLYPHQQEGFEFIWRNLAGTIMLNELKYFENSDETGGCIMSHAPGTGKTRLTIMFLQSYLECFPDCKPVIIAPASLLLTWAEEFKKWKVSVPFHNLSSLDLNGKENSAAFNLLMHKNSSGRTNNEIRMVKIYSWIKEKSILGISYNLYEKLAGVRDEDKKAKTVKPDRELDAIREILMGKPGLLVLDEAHTPRNQRSCIWKTLSKVETQKRILLSGTPFQNNFQELCNVLGLARPKYLERLTSTLKKSGMAVTKRGRKGLGDGINNRGIAELKAVMLPFVHVHKGSILQKSLFGLRECVVVLNPPELQKRVLESIEVTHNQKTKNVFETEHKLSLVSVHPSLVSHCTLSPKERLTINEALLAQLRKVRLDPNQSVKTRFLMEFIALCEVVKEKVLVFSQYIDPLKLIMKHLVSRFKWREGEQVLYMHGKLEQKQRQTLINEFNDPNSKAKVFLASTKACSEGISLVGASRVILLDVVWNPAVERQAISRAYRIGQEKVVYTYHLVAKGTPEGPKYCKQAQKDRISELVFACSSKHDKGKEKIDEAVTEDKLLDMMLKHMKLGDLFDNLIVQPKEADLVEGFNNILMP